MTPDEQKVMQDALFASATEQERLTTEMYEAYRKIVNCPEDGTLGDTLTDLVAERDRLREALRLAHEALDEWKDVLDQFDDGPSTIHGTFGVAVKMQEKAREAAKGLLP